MALVKRLIFWVSLGLSILVVLMNVWVLTQSFAFGGTGDWSSSSSSSSSTVGRLMGHADFAHSFTLSAATDNDHDNDNDNDGEDSSLQKEKVQAPSTKLDDRRKHYFNSGAGSNGGAGGNGNGADKSFRRSRTLMGIITADTLNECSYRKRHRELFQIWNDTRVCSLPELKGLPPTQRDRCQLVYTFVMGAGASPTNGKDSPPTQITNASYPLYRTTPMVSKYDDVQHDDVTLLNIKENMNEGKSPTFFYFASTILEEYDLDYAMKFDGDSILHLHDWFLFAHHHLPPRPYGNAIAAGALRHKAYWPPPPNPSDLYRLEHHWQSEYHGVHLYLAGQCYLMSLELCKWVVQEAPRAAHRLGPGGYLEGHEDHDVISMVFQHGGDQDQDQDHIDSSHSSQSSSRPPPPPPRRLVTIGKSQRFWEHPVKGQPRWDRIRKRELARMSGQGFEKKKKLRVYLDE